jgi:hypothetical protein
VLAAIATVRLGDGGGVGEWLELGAGGCESIGFDDGVTGFTDGTGLGTGGFVISRVSECDSG